MLNSRILASLHSVPVTNFEFGAYGPQSTTKDGKKAGRVESAAAYMGNGWVTWTSGSHDIAAAAFLASLTRYLLAARWRHLRIRWASF